MRAAVVLTCGEGPQVREHAVPQPGPGEVVVAVEAVAITPLDLLCAGGTSYFGTPATPYVPGVQGVGRVGGQLVWFPTAAGMQPGDGSMAEFAVAREQDLVELAEGTDVVALAAAGLSAVAALVATLWRGQLAEGETVIVLGGGGVVGQAAIQFARRAGAARIVAGVRSPAARERALAAGAHAVVDLEGENGSVDAAFAEATDGGADLVIDPLFGAPAAAAAKALRPGGRLVNLGSSAGETSPLDSATIRSRSLRLLGYTNNELTSAERATAVRQVADAVADGSLSVGHEVVALSEVATAWARQAGGTANGRVVLIVREGADSRS